MLELAVRPALSELRSVVESLQAEVLTDLPDARVEEDFAELHVASEQLEAERLRRLAEVERRGLFARDGHLSAVAWLASRFHLGWGRAKEQIRLARGLAEMPQARAAFQAGDISSSGFRLLVQARDVDPEAFARSEAVLVDAARGHTICELNKVLARWRLLAEQERYPDPQERFQARRGLFASATFDGMVRTDGDLTPEVGESYLSALGAVMDAEAHGGPHDERTPPQRRHDALGVICRAFLDSSDRPSVGGERPHLTLSVDLETLKAGTGVAEAEHAGPVDVEFARQVACDASVRRIVMGPGSEPLDVGRATPVVSVALRRAVIARDRHCRFPGCDRPKSWCDAHHVAHWADGGETALSNLVLLCRRHHRLVHANGGFSLRMVDGRPEFRRPDGSALQDRGPPS
jgi:Domain of unknown function (DUF222)/HNH endonuclease